MLTGLLSVIAVLTAIIFVVVPVVLTVTITVRYRKVERAIAHSAALVRVLIAYLERGELPDVEAATPAVTIRDSSAGAPQTSLFERLLLAVRTVMPTPPRVSRFRVKDDFEDYLTVIRQGENERERYIRFKRKNLSMQQTLIEDLEFCRAYTEALPYMGILGTVLGFFFSPAVFAPNTANATNVGGLVLALTSTAAALACILVIKLFFENTIIPQYIEFVDALRAVDDYMGRYGELAAELAHKASS